MSEITIGGIVDAFEIYLSQKITLSNKIQEEKLMNLTQDLQSAKAYILSLEQKINDLESLKTDMETVATGSAEMKAELQDLSSSYKEFREKKKHRFLFRC